ncbi:PAS domain-containing protein [Pigmentibacter sp. JX0631]|uniref:PAS domain-containing protein n=1 Tax=Pigmentibacter sp. JX0631 TaxID=2976982 RepID=UPI002468BF1D|nr:PAS domain-containing protein [Pigmentibacter sp. JX0631]WGL59399.1 PAS domain-containing protein [Pigmentibacter sp. JX0631]
MNALQNTQSKEVDFDFDEIFFSITDKKGIILDGNKVFTRVSGFPKEELINKPHNIIRHPEMPKCVFKLLWEKLKDNKGIVAYIKNKDAKGNYYWVLSSVLPIQNGYLSIRIKPQSSLFQKIKDLYIELLSTEKNSNINNSYDLFMKKIIEMGFESYDSFMTRALSSELFLNKKFLAHKENIFSKKVSNEIYSEVNRNFLNNKKEFSVIIEKMKLLIEFAPLLKEKTDQILLSCNKLDYISLNMSINSGNLGQQTASVSIISREFQIMVSTIRTQVRKFQDISKELRTLLEMIELEGCLAFIQIQTIENYLLDYFEFFSSGDSNVNIIAQNVSILFSLFIDNSNTKLIKSLDKSQYLCKNLLEISNSLKGKIFSLEITKDLSKIEISRNPSIEGYFDNQILDIHQFIISNKENIANILTETNKVANDLHVFSGNVSKMKNYINLIKTKLNQIVHVKEKLAS